MRSFLLAALAPSAAYGLNLSLSDSDGLNPVQKVVKLLKDMQNQVQSEFDEDKKTYEKINCWCANTKKEKETAIADNGQRSKELTAKIEELTAKHSSLGEEIKKLESDLVENKQGLAEATAQREKEAEQYHEDNKDNIATVGAIRGALTVLKRVNKSFLQTGQKENMKKLLKRIEVSYPETIGDDASHVLSLLAVPAYENQSGEIFGVLSSMQEELEKDMQEGAAEETKKAAAFKEMSDAKSESINSMQNMLMDKNDQHTKAGLDNEDTKEDLKDTEKMLEADTDFLADLNEKCAANEEEYNSRQKDRGTEIKAISETLEIVTGDAMRDLTFVQLGSKQNLNEKIEKYQDRYTRQRVASFLQRRNVNNSYEMNLLATSAQLDAFTKVKKNIDAMIEALKTQQADESKERDFCIAEQNSNDMNLVKVNRKKDLLLAKKDDLAKEAEEIQTQIKRLIKEIMQANVDLQQAAEDRQEAAKEYKKTISDNTAVCDILGKAKERLGKYYSFMQVSVHQPEKAPVMMKKGGYSNNGGGVGVLAMLSKIISDTETTSKEATKDEQDAVTAYQSFVAKTNKSQDERKRAVVANNMKAAANKEASVANGTDIESNTTCLQKLGQYKEDLKKRCTFLVKNFEVTQKAREEEMTALTQAKAILSGAK